MTTSLQRRLALVALCCAACADGAESAPAGGPSPGHDASIAPIHPLDAGSLADTGATAGPDASTPGDAALAFDAGLNVDEDAQLDAARADASIGSGGVLAATIVVKKGQSFDGGGKRYTAGPALGSGSQAEGQKPLFKLEDGASLANVVLGAPAADGIHTHGNVTLTNIVWEDIGEDALTIKESGTVVLNGGSATNGSDKVFQINAASTFRVSDFIASDAGKFIRQNGGTTFKVQVFIERCDISRMDEAIFRTDSSTSTVSMKNSRYSQIGDELFMGVAPANIVSENNSEY